MALSEVNRGNFTLTQCNMLPFATFAFRMLRKSQHSIHVNWLLLLMIRLFLNAFDGVLRLTYGSHMSLPPINLLDTFSSFTRLAPVA